MAKLTLSLDDTNYALQHTEVCTPGVPFGDRVWEVHLANLEHEERVPGSDSLYGYLYAVLEFMAKMEEKRGGGAHGVMRNAITYAYATVYSARNWSLPLVRRSHLEAVRSVFPDTEAGVIDRIQANTLAAMTRVHPIWTQQFMTFIQNKDPEMHVFQKHLACASVLALLACVNTADGDWDIDLTELEEQKMEPNPEKGKAKDAPAAPVSNPLVREPRHTFADIGGNRTAKEQLLGLARRLMQPSVGARWGSKPLKGILLKGPKGTGKSIMAEAFAKEVGLPFLSLAVSDTLSLWVNHSPAILANHFQAARKAGGAILFFDEADAIIGQRGSKNGHNEDDKVVNEFNIQMDRLTRQDRVLVILATNFEGKLDEAAIRDQRVDLVLDVPLPDEDDRLDILATIACRIERAAGHQIFKIGIKLDEVARRTAGLSGAALENIIDRALWAKEDADIAGDMPGLVNTADLLRAMQQRSAQRTTSNRRIGFAVQPVQPTLRPIVSAPRKAPGSSGSGTTSS